MIKKFFRKRLINRNTSRWMLLFIDSFVILNTFILSYIIGFNFNLIFNYPQFFYQLPLVLIIFLISFIAIGSYKGIMLQTGSRNTFNVIKAAFAAFITLLVLVLINKNFNFSEYLSISISILIIHFFINLIVLVSIRFLFKQLYYSLFYNLRKERRVLIYGVGKVGRKTYSFISGNKDIKALVVGFLDDDSNKSGKKLNGLKVFNSKKLTEDFIKSKGVNEIIIAIKVIKPQRLLEIFLKLSKLPTKTTIVTPSNNWVEGYLNFHQIKKIEIENLLGSEPITVNNPILNKEFNLKVILITGAAGSVGGEILIQLSNYNYKHLVLIDYSESNLHNLRQFFLNKGFKNITSIVADVRDNKSMNSIFEQFQPHIVFHAVTYKHTPIIKENLYEAVNLNVEGTKRIADLSVKYKVEKFILISSYKEENSVNITGATKRIAEMYLNCLDKESKTKFITTRFVDELGSRGSLISLFKNQIEKEGALTLNHKDITRFFMAIPEICQLILEAAAIGIGGEIFVIDIGNSVKIYDLSKNMIQLSDLQFSDGLDNNIGSPPNEKIYEELLADAGNTKASYHEIIMIANTQKLESESVKADIGNLCAINKEHDFNKTLLIMKEIIPEFEAFNPSNKTKKKVS